MTADIRTAAQREEAAHLEAMRAARGYAPGDIEAQHDFACGYLVADRARVTPTREQITAIVEKAIYDFADPGEPIADAVLALMQALRDVDQP